MMILTLIASSKISQITENMTARLRGIYTITEQLTIHVWYNYLIIKWTSILLRQESKNLGLLLAIFEQISQRFLSRAD